MKHLKPVNAFPPVGIIHVDEVADVPALEIVTHVHTPVAPDALDPHPSRLRHGMHDKVKGVAQAHLQSIPVRVVFDTPEHNIRARYEGWSDGFEGMPICTGNGSKAVVLNHLDGTRHARVCKGPKLCHLVNRHGVKCALQVRMDVLVDGQPFEVRSSSENAYTAILTALKIARARYGALSRQAFLLQTWEKSTRGSGYQPFTSITLLRTNPVDGEAVSSETDAAMEELGSELLENWSAACELSMADSVPDGVELPFNMPMPKARSTESRAPRTGVAFSTGGGEENIFVGALKASANAQAASLV